jgi:PAS domain S-box-containing protein
MKQPPLFHQVIFDSLYEGMYTVDKNFKIIGFNQAAEKLTGYAKDEIMGKFCKNVFRTDRCQQGCPLTYSLEMGENVRNYDMVMKDSNDNEIQLKINGAIFRSDNNEPVGGVLLFRPVSDLKSNSVGITKRHEFHGIIGQNKHMQELYILIEEISDSDSAVLIQGESGTGKELIANAVQQMSMRKNKPFIKVNCSVFPHDLLASELFGHVKGAFTDAHRDRIGRFEMANGGSIFLDEIAEADPRIQIQLLRVLQEGTFERVGESLTHKVDVRIIAATNLDIQKAIASGKFREDLYYRLNVIPIHIPPLRERKDDIPFLLQHFLQRYSLLTGKRINEIDDPSMEILMQHDWPGNVRELENAIEYAFSRTKSTTITPEKLPPALKQEHYNVPFQTTKSSKYPGEYDKIKGVLEEVHWNRSKAAQKLGIGRATLWRKMKVYDLLS